MNEALEMFKDLQVLARGVYLQIVFAVKLLDDAIIRSNEPEEVLTFRYEKLGNRFIIPWRKFKGKLRRLVMEKQRFLGISTDCALKDNLCMRCPCCLLFGGTGETSSAKTSYNLLSRVLGETLISLGNMNDVSTYTANAVSEEDLTTGQALMSILKVPVETEFVGVLTLRDPTPELAAIVCDNLNRLTRLGASTREWGKCEIDILGYQLIDRENLSTYALAQLPLDKIKKEVNPLSDLKLLDNVDRCYREVNEQIMRILPAQKAKSK